MPRSALVHVVQADAELGAVVCQLVELANGNGLGKGEIRPVGRRGMVHRRHGALRAADAQPALAQHGEGLGRGHLVDQVQVDVEHGRPAFLLGHHVRVPDFVEKGLWSAHHQLPVVSGQ
jgi:hypothetical protein